jgi:biotin operon repressor
MPEPTATGTRIGLHLPQQDLGRMLGVSRQMVSAALTRIVAEAGEA